MLVGKYSKDNDHETGRDLVCGVSKTEWPVCTGE